MLQLAKYEPSGPLRYPIICIYVIYKVNDLWPRSHGHKMFWSNTCPCVPKISPLALLVPMLSLWRLFVHVSLWRLLIPMLCLWRHFVHASLWRLLMHGTLWGEIKIALTRPNFMVLQNKLTCICLTGHHPCAELHQNWPKRFWDICVNAQMHARMDGHEQIPPCVLCRQSILFVTSVMIWPVHVEGVKTSPSCFNPSPKLFLSSVRKRDGSFLWSNVF